MEMTIDEIIGHCNRTCENTEMLAVARGQTQEDITSKGYWEHYHVAKYLEELKRMKDAEEQGVLLRNPKDLEDAILDRMQEFMDEWRSYSESSVDHFGGKADAMEVAQKIVKGAFKSYLEEAEAALAEIGDV